MLLLLLKQTLPREMGKYLLFHFKYKEWKAVTIANRYPPSMGELKISSYWVLEMGRGEFLRWIYFAYGLDLTDKANMRLLSIFQEWYTLCKYKYTSWRQVNFD